MNANGPRNAPIPDPWTSSHRRAGKGVAGLCGPTPVLPGGPPVTDVWIDGPIPEDQVWPWWNFHFDAVTHVPIACFAGIIEGPTAAPGTSNNQLATTEYVMSLIQDGVAGVASFNGRVGNVTLTSADVTAAGGAALNSPAFSGTPTAPTPPAAAIDGEIATASFVRGLVLGAFLPIAGGTITGSLAVNNLLSVLGAINAGGTITAGGDVNLSGNLNAGGVLSATQGANLHSITLTGDGGNWDLGYNGTSVAQINWPPNGSNWVTQVSPSAYLIAGNNGNPFSLIASPPLRVEIGTNWVIRVVGSATPPASALPGSIYYDTSVNQLQYWNGSAWSYLAAGGGGGPFLPVNNPIFTGTLFGPGFSAGATGISASNNLSVGAGTSSISLNGNVSTDTTIGSGNALVVNVRGFPIISVDAASGVLSLGTITGPSSSETAMQINANNNVVLTNPATLPLGVTTLAQVQALIGAYLPLAGGTLTGPLVINLGVSVDTALTVGGGGIQWTFGGAAFPTPDALSFRFDPTQTARGRIAYALNGGPGYTWLANSDDLTALSDSLSELSTQVQALQAAQE